MALDPDGRQWRTLGTDRAIGCVYWVGAEVAEPGVIRQDGRGAALPIGEPDSTRSDRVVALAQAMTPVRSNIRGEIWTKMVNSLRWKPVASTWFSTSRACSASEKSDPNANPATADRSTLRQARPSGSRFNSCRRCPKVKATATAKTCSRTQED